MKKIKYLVILVVFVVGLAACARQPQEQEYKVTKEEKGIILLNGSTPLRSENVKFTTEHGQEINDFKNVPGNIWIRFERDNPEEKSSFWINVDPNKTLARIISVKPGDQLCPEWVGDLFEKCSILKATISYLP